ncbi:hypothetical protein [Flavobacterium sp. S87F.05.LMB.W.Kidney.N]|uniref:hypothetical protein n=1 Tax=Flavobacterium sp. S87F.05.LMB.W.Kidney.N TaxID=1278758 RepID=UPI001065494D|nr:hypothetical protein [Flavobacterium sp. S87F.05.LMB.W.Kidney.N]TDX11209.1 hypothetical protein EDB96_1987 [Flavobacterium sp. S87F.05.LMB.W.Kidney.N]
MAIQTLNTIKNWFKTSLKPSQQQFWDTWDSFRHKLDKVPVKDVDGIEELIEKSIPKTSISGDLNRLTKIGYDSEEKLNLIQSNITDTGDKIIINSNTEINSKIDGKSGLKLKNLKNQFKSISEIVYNQDVIPSAGIDGTAYFPYGNTVKKVNLDKTVVDYFSFSEGDYIQSKIIVSPKNGDLFLIYFDGVSYILIKFDESGILSVLKSSNSYFSYIDIDKNDNIYVEERSSRKIFKINTYTISETVYYAGNLSLGFLGFDEELNGYFFDFESRNVIYKINESGIITNFALLNLEVGNGCVKPDGSLYITPYDYADINIYSVDKNGTSVTFFASIGYKANEPFVSENGFLYVHNNDYENGLVYKISPLGEVIILGSAGKSPRYMTVAKSGIVYISNSASYNLIKITLQEDTKLLTLDNDGNVIFSDKEVTVKSDFKTVNGESIVGTGNISLIASSDLDQTLEKGNTAIGKTLTLSNFDETAEIFLHPNSLSLNNEGNSTHLISQGSYLRSDYQSSGGGVNHLYLKRNIPGINFFNLPENPDGTTNIIPVSVNGEFADEEGNINLPSGNISGTPNVIPTFNGNGDGLENSLISIDGNTAVVTSGILNDSGLKFADLKNYTSFTKTTVRTSESFPMLTAQNENNGDIAITYQNVNKVDILNTDGVVKFTTILSSIAISLAYDSSDNLYLSHSNNSITKIDSDFNIIENFLTNITNTTLFFSNKIMFCINRETGSVIKLNTNTGETEIHCNIKPYSYFTLGDNNEFYCTDNEGVYRSDEDIITPIYLLKSITDIAYKNGIIYILDYTNSKLIGLDSEGSVVLEGTTGQWPQHIIFDNSNNIIVYSNYSPLFISQFTLIKPSGESKVIANQVGTNFRDIYKDSENNFYGVSWSSSQWTKLIYSEKNYLLALDDQGKVIGLDKKDFRDTITLENVLNAGGYAIKGNTKLTSFYEAFFNYDSSGDNQISFASKKDVNNSNLIIGNGKFQVKETGASGYTQIQIVEPVANANLRFPAPTISGDYEIALTKVFTNNTTNALSTSSLNSTYRQAQKGDTVQCLNITTGSVIYTKTDTGWVQNNVTSIV